MSITSTQRTPRLALASGAGTALFLLLASACGTENAVSQAPGSISEPKAASTEHQSSTDRAECLVNQAKNGNGGIPCQEQTTSTEVEQPLYLAPSGRPVPLPGQDG
jgi:hypothetical protein